MGTVFILSRNLGSGTLNMLWCFFLFLKVLTQLLCCEMWFCENLLTVKCEDFFFFFCWSAMGFCDLQPISVQYILYVFVSETAQCLQEMHSFAVGHMGSFAFLWWRWEDKVCCLLFFSFLKLLLCFVPAYSWGILKDAWDNAEFSPSNKHLQQTIKFIFSKFRRTTS